MKTTIKTIIFLVASSWALSLGSCDSLLDQEEIDFGKGPIVVQFQKKTTTNNFLQDGSGTVYNYEVPIEYHGADGNPLDGPVTITVGVNSESTATEGVEFELGETEFTIPANQKTANVIIQVNSENLDAENPKTVTLEIVSSSQTISDKNTSAITMQAICPSNLEGNYIDADYGIAITVTSTGTGTYEVSRGTYFSTAYPFYISDVCNNLTITGGYITDNFGIPVSGTGSADPDTGTLTLYHTTDGYFTEREIILVKQ